jgi:hypothetical protein
MSKILLHLDKTENLLHQVKNNLLKELKNCENELLSYEIRESLLKVERREFRFNHLKNSLNTKYNRKDSNQLKRVYKSLKKMS